MPEYGQLYDALVADPVYKEQLPDREKFVSSMQSDENVRQGLYNALQGDEVYKGQLPDTYDKFVSSFQVEKKSPVDSGRPVETPSQQPPSGATEEVEIVPVGGPGAQYEWGGPVTQQEVIAQETPFITAEKQEIIQQADVETKERIEAEKQAARQADLEKQRERVTSTLDTYKSLQEGDVVTPDIRYDDLKTIATTGAYTDKGQTFDEYAKERFPELSTDDRRVLKQMLKSEREAEIIDASRENVINRIQSGNLSVPEITVDLVSSAKEYFTPDQIKMADMLEKRNAIISEMRNPTEETDMDALETDLENLNGSLSAMREDTTDLFDPETGKLIARSEASEEDLAFEKAVQEETKRQAAIFSGTDAANFIQNMFDTKAKLAYYEDEYRKFMTEKVLGRPEGSDPLSMDEINDEIAKYDPVQGLYGMPGVNPVMLKHQDERESIYRNMVDARRQFIAMSRAVLLNEDLTASKKRGFFRSAGEALVEAALPGDIDIETESDLRKAMIQAVGPGDLTEEQLKQAEDTFGEQAGQDVGTSIPIMAEIALTGGVVGAIGKAPAVASRLNKLQKVMTGAKASKIFGGAKNAEFAYNVMSSGVKGALTFAPTELTAEMGAAEGFTQGLLGEFGMDKFLSKSKWGKLAGLTLKTLAGASAETVAEFAGDYVQNLADSGFDTEDAFRETFGRDMDDFKDRLALTAMTSLMFSGTFNVAQAKSMIKAMEPHKGNDAIDVATSTLEKAVADHESAPELTVTEGGKPVEFDEQGEPIKPTEEATFTPEPEVKAQELEVPETTQEKTEEDAIQEQQTAEVPVGEQAGGSQEVGEAPVEAEQKIEAESEEKVEEEKKPTPKTIKQDTPGLTQKEEFKQGFEEYVSARDLGDKAKVEKAKAKQKKKFEKEKASLNEKIEDGKNKNKEIRSVKEDIANHVNELLDAIHEAGVKKIPTKKAKSIVNKIRQAKTYLSLEKAKNEATDLVDRIVESEADRVKRLDRLKKARQARNNAKSTSSRASKFGNNLNAHAIAKLDVSEVPSNLLEKYDAAIENLGQRSANIVMDNAAINDFHEAYSEYVESLIPEVDSDVSAEDVQESEEKASKSLEKEMEARTDLSNEISNMAKSINTSKISAADQRSLVRQLKKIPKDWLLTRSSKELEGVLSAMQNAESGWTVGKHIQAINSKYSAKKASDAISKNKGRLDTADRAIVKRFKSAEKLKGKIEDTMLTYIDHVVGKIKETPIYENFISPITRGITAADQNYRSEVLSEFNDLLKKAGKSVGKGKEFEFSVLAEIFFRENEYKSNPGRPKLVPFSDHLAEMTKKDSKGDYVLEGTEYTKEELDLIQDIYKSLEKDSDGTVDLDKMPFTPEQKKLLNFMLDVNENNLMGKNQFINLNYRGKNLDYYKNYAPRTAVKDREIAGNIDDYINSHLAGSMNLITHSSNERTGEGVALRINPFQAFLSNARATYTDYYVTPAIKNAQLTSFNLQNSTDKDIRVLGKALEGSTKDLIRAHYNQVYGTKSFNESIFDFLKNNQVKSVLLSSMRIGSEMITNSFGRGVYNNSRSATKEQRKEFNKGKDKSGKSAAQKKLEKLYGSTQMSRTGSFSVERTTEGDRVKSKYSKLEPSAKDLSRDILADNVASNITDSIFEGYYKIADRGAKIVWQSQFLSEFENQTGEKFNVDEFLKEDNEYADKYQSEIKKSLSKADYETSTWYNTGSQAEQKIKQQLDKAKNPLKASVLHYMQSFAYNENSVLMDAIRSTYGKGSLEGKMAAAKIIAVTSRAVLHNALIGATTAIAMAAAGVDEDEDYLKEALPKELERSLWSLGLLVAIGNKSTPYKVAASVAINYIHKLLLHDEGVDGSYNKYEHAPLYARGSSLESLGPVSGILETLDEGTDVAAKVLDKVSEGEGLSMDDVADLDLVRVAGKLAGATLGVGGQKEIKVLQKKIDQEYEKKSRGRGRGRGRSSRR